MWHECEFVPIVSARWRRPRARPDWAGLVRRATDSEVRVRLRGDADATVGQCHRRQDRTERLRAIAMPCEDADEKHEVEGARVAMDSGSSGRAS